MKIAYLILAHNTPHHLKRLIGALDSPNVAVFVHVDRKSDIGPFRDGISRTNVTFLDERADVYWGDFSIIPVMIRLIEEALTHDPDYLCLLSGSDYPLRSAAYIEDFFARNRGREFMNLVRLPCEEVNKPIGRIEDYWFQTPFDSQLVIRATNRLNDLNRRYGFKRDHTKVFKGLAAYAGSTWWALTAGACRHVLDFTRARPDVVKFVRNVPNPDESFFQIAIGNSGFAKQVVRNLTFTDWSRPIAPALIDMDHLQGFLKTDAVMGDDAYGRGELLFARKFCDNSAHLTDFIDVHIRNRG